MLSLKDKVAFISGAGSVGDDPDAKVWGNGKATAVLLARQGAKIYGVDLRKEAAFVTKALIEKEGGTCLTRGVDMTKADEVKAAVDDCGPNFRGRPFSYSIVPAGCKGQFCKCVPIRWSGRLNFKITCLGKFDL
jgi:NAD(P)-dependent dehydrogenase (short-subunit alcohol dehydrogenase family)